MKKESAISGNSMLLIFISTSVVAREKKKLKESCNHVQVAMLKTEKPFNQELWCSE